MENRKYIWLQQTLFERLFVRHVCTATTGMEHVQYDSAHTTKQITALVILLLRGAIIWFL